MPEFAEVKIITEQLQNHLQNKELQQIIYYGGRYSNQKPSGFIELENLLSHNPIQIKQINHHGKFIYWIFSTHYLWNTLGMTGEWSRSPSEHSALGLLINNERIFFNDIRHFGTLQFVLDAKKMQAKLKSFGPEVVKISIKEFYQKLQKPENICSFLMNQKNLAGVGNYIKSESLYLAKISPWRITSSLSFEEAELLLKSINKVIQTSYLLGGATLATYKNFEGNAGKFSKNFQVYKKILDPVNNLVKSEQTPDKRTTHWVPGIQK